jgi:hypothetical protein
MKGFCSFNEQRKKVLLFNKNNTFSSKKIENIQINLSDTYQDV